MIASSSAQSIPAKSAPTVCIFPEVLESGIGRYAINLSHALMAEGARVDLFLTREYGDLIDHKPKGARLLVGDGSTKASLGKLYRYLRREKPDLLITAHNHVNAASILVKALAFVPTKLCVTIHTAMSRDDMSGNPRKKRIISQLCRMTYPFANKVVAVSNAVADDTTEYLGLARQKIDVIYNPVVKDDLFNTTSEADHPFFKSGEPVFLSLGRLSEQKDFLTLLKAFRLVRKKQKAKLLILGEGEDRKKLEAFIRENNLEGDVALLGFMQNAYAYLAKADAFVSSSLWEGLPTVLIEALALGVPIVATDCPGGSSEILAGGEYGLLVKMSNPSDLAAAMLTILKDPTPKSKLLARAKDFSFEASALSYLDLLT